MRTKKSCYVGHEGRELELMLAGKKPLSMFYDGADEKESVIPEDEFDPFVKNGQFAKGTEIFERALDPRTGKPYRIEYVLYALKEEEWRIRAMFLVLRTLMGMAKADEGIDRITGSLLGYSDEENDQYIASRHR